MLRAPAAVRPRVVMFNMAELSCRYHFDARYSLIDMPVAFAALLVIPNLPDFYRQHPDIDIILSSSDRRRDMLRDGLDCVLRVGELDDGDYIARKIGNIKITTCASPAWLAEHGTPETLEDLRKHQAINWINNSSRHVQPWTFTTPARVAAPPAR